MTSYGDNIYSGSQAITSALQSLSAVQLCRTHNFSQPAGGGATPITQTGTFPADTINLDAKLYINANASATVSDKFTVSANGVNLISITGVGSAIGVLRNTQAGLGTLSTISSACSIVASAVGTELSYSITFLPASASKSTNYQLQLLFNRKDITFGT